MLFVCLLAALLAVCQCMFTYRIEEPRVSRDSSHNTPASLSIYSYKTGEHINTDTSGRYKKKCGVVGDWFERRAMSCSGILAGKEKERFLAEVQVG